MKKATQRISGKNAQDVVAKCAERRGMNYAELSSAMGEIRQRLNQQMGCQDMKMRRFVEVLEYLGFEVVAVEVDFRRVTPKAAQEIIKTGNPKGLFWAEENGTYVAVNSNCGGTLHKEFSNADKMRKWLSGEA